MVDFSRYIRNLLVFPPRTRRVFPDSLMEKIEAIIAEAESQQGCEIRFVVEGGLPLRYLSRDKAIHERASDLFSQLKIWDTERNNGILFYLVLSEKTFQIVADRGVSAVVSEEQWKILSTSIQQEFQSISFEAGILRGIRELASLLKPHFPEPVKSGELSNRPLLY